MQGGGLRLSWGLGFRARNPSGQDREEEWGRSTQGGVMVLGLSWDGRRCGGVASATTEAGDGWPHLPGALITPYSIGKDLTVCVEKLFETSIPPETIRTRARRIKERGGQITTPPTTPLNPTQIPEKPPNQPEDELGKVKAWGTGPGRPPKPAPSLTRGRARVFRRTRELKPGSRPSPWLGTGVRHKHATLPFLPLYGPALWGIVWGMNF